MSGPIDDDFAGEVDPGGPGVEIREGRPTDVRGMGVLRVLPTKGRRTVGPWCFVDLMTPADVADPDPMEIGPHPHIGLATVTWLFEGEALHTDSLGSEQVIRPGELNLMTAGNGIAHAELEVRRGSTAAAAEYVKGAQMWLAQPDTSRHGPPQFGHYNDLPRVALADAEAQVLAGTLAGTTSPVPFDWPLLGADLTLRSQPADVPVDPTFEHAVIPIDRPLAVEDVIVDPGWLAIVPPGQRQLRLETGGEGGRMLLLGGAPFPVRIQMWWNFVARTRAELTQAWIDWRDHNDDRFGPVASQLGRIDAPKPIWIRDGD